MTKILFLLLLASVSSFAQDNLNEDIRNADTPVLNTQAPEEHEKIVFRKSHWITNFGSEGTKYEIPYNFPEGVKKRFKTKDQEFYGARLALGREFYLGAGFLTTTKVEGYYDGTLFSSTLNGGNVDANIKFAFTKNTGQIYGADVSQALSHIFEFKYTNPFLGDVSRMSFEPFIEGGIGMARAFNKLNYQYALAGTNEAYKLKVEDQILNTKLAVGFNLTSDNGYFFFMKVTQNRYDITDRKTYQLKRVNGGTDTVTKPDLDDKMDPILTWNLGGGYKF